MQSIIICGAPRAGTTALYNYLFDHPQIGGGLRKELHYFFGGEWGNDQWTGLETREEYLEQFPQNIKYSLEASPGYMWPPTSDLIASRIRSLIPDVHLVFIIRNPRDRLISHYLVERERAKLDVSLNEYVVKHLDAALVSLNDKENFTVNPVLLGCYSISINKFLHHFQKCQIHLIDFDEFSNNPLQVIEGLCESIGVDKQFFDSYNFAIYNQTVAYKNKQFHYYVAALYKFLPYFVQRNLGNIKKMYNFFASTEFNKLGLQMDIDISRRLDEFFLPYNKQLLNDIGEFESSPSFKWLVDAVNKNSN